MERTESAWLVMEGCQKLFAKKRAEDEMMCVKSGEWCLLLEESWGI